MPEITKQKVLQLEPILGNYEACKFIYAFPMEKRLNYKPLKLPDGYMFMTCVYMPIHNKRRIILLLMLC